MLLCFGVVFCIEFFMCGWCFCLAFFSVGIAGRQKDKVKQEGRAGNSMQKITAGRGAVGLLCQSTKKSANLLFIMGAGYLVRGRWGWEILFVCELGLQVRSAIPERVKNSIVKISV